MYDITTCYSYALLGALLIRRLSSEWLSGS